MKCSSVLLMLPLAVAGCTKATQTSTDRDNSAINQRDRSDSAKTPLDQNENQQDIDITAKIRRQVVDTEMSVNAQNIKIMTQNGKVTLRGPVATAQEKSQIELIARNVAGESNVTSQIDITTVK